MIHFDRFVLENGLIVLVNSDNTTPLAAINVLYNVGSKDESPDKTGIAHFFEHLMFSGSQNIASYDNELQLVGGDNNAFTSNDMTNYYLTLPKQNLETAFWLESDRMLSLNITREQIEIQRNVVIEEFKQRFLNQPYGDIFLLLRNLAYQQHPYKWTTIGKDISHIQNITFKDITDFSDKYYGSDNAILSVSGNVTTEDVTRLCEKWFAPIKSKNIEKSPVQKEPKQTEERKLLVERDVPFDAIYKTYHICNRADKKYHTCDLLSDILSIGKSARLYQELVKNKQLFSSIDASITGDIDEGLFIVSGKINKEIDMKTAEEAIDTELDKLKKESVSDFELEKVKNKAESYLLFSRMNILNRGMHLAYHELLGDANGVNNETQKYHRVKKEQIFNLANEIFVPENCSTLYYKAAKH